MNPELPFDPAIIIKLIAALIGVVFVLWFLSDDYWMIKNRKR